MTMQMSFHWSFNNMRVVWALALIDDWSGLDAESHSLHPFSFQLLKQNELYNCFKEQISDSDILAFYQFWQ